ncbi:MAG TPA: phosphoribosylanthranilate isomerase [Capillimicrobium sp.]|nr:phosphoribosylanthranilate isomerase [Capillimicrobium sp.]
MEAPKVKICGVTTVEDAELAVELGAWAVGLIFHRPSPRRARLAAAEEIGASIRRRALVTGVFVNHPLDAIMRHHERVGFDVVQLHGDEGPAFCAEVARRTGAKVTKAARVRDAGDVRALDAFRSVDFHLVDGVERGEPVDPALRRARRSGIPLLIAGSLTPGNVAEAVAAWQPFGVDVASGVEAEPGRKDPEKLAAFFAAVRGAVPAS